jgi:glycosyltransferase involved in cell wall biosynthesis
MASRCVNAELLDRGIAMKIGIAICTFNRLGTLKETVARVQAHTKSDYDLIVVDDGSSDGTQEAMERLGVNILSTANRGIAWNKNKALYYLLNFTKSDIIILLEDDTFPVEDNWEKPWAEAIVRWGHINLGARHWGKAFFHAGNGTPEQPYKSTHVSAQCAGFSSECINVVGFFDSRFRGWGMEHVEHTSRLIRAGFGGEPITSINKTLYYVIDSNLEILFREESIGFDSDEKKNKQIADNMEVCNRIGADKIRRDPWSNDEEMGIFLSQFNLFHNDQIFLHLSNDEKQAMVHDLEANRILFVTYNELYLKRSLRQIICFYNGYKLQLLTIDQEQIDAVPANVFGIDSQNDRNKLNDLVFDVVLDPNSGIYLKAGELYLTCDKSHGNICVLDRSYASDWERFYLSHIQRLPWN